MMKILKSYEIFENFEIYKIYNIFWKFWTLKKKIAIWLADWKWNLVSGWTTLKHRIDNSQKLTQARIYLTRGVLTARGVYSLHTRYTHSEVELRKCWLGQSAKSKIPYHLIILYIDNNHMEYLYNIWLLSSLWIYQNFEYIDCDIWVIELVGHALSITTSMPIFGNRHHQ